MPLPKSLTQPLRQGQLTVGAGWRAYFAPFNQALAVTTNSLTVGPKIYDLQVLGKLVESSMPAGWFDLGYLKSFRFTPQSKIGSVVAGYRGAIKAKYRAEVGEQLACTFGEYSRMALKIATGSQVFNLLYSTASASTDGPLSSSGTAATPLGASGYQPTGVAATATAGLPTLFVPSGSGAGFQAGQYIVCDIDYNGTSFGFVGDAGVNVFQGAVTDTDFIRKTSDYVARIKQVVVGVAGQDALILNAPLVGGGNNSSGAGSTAPASNAKVQRVVGYASREGGTTITEWSGLFILDTINAAQILMYYPRISPNQYSGMAVANLQNATAMQTYELDASFDSLAFDDPLDGETVVRYSAYFPPPDVDIQI